MIEFTNVSKTYPLNQTTALKKLNLTINDGDFFVLVGESGSGKTTSLKMINGLITPSSGIVNVAGTAVQDHDIEKLRLHMGYVLQNIALFPNLNVQDNIAIQLEMLKMPRNDRISRSKVLLEQVGLAPQKYAERMPSELSGGEQQRVSIARALAVEPKVVLMDEPFSALDPLSRQQLQNLVLELHQQVKTTFVFVTHDMQEALRLGTRIAVMKDGSLQQVGTPAEITTRPANNFVRDLFASTQNGDLTTIADLIGAGFGEETTNTDPHLPVTTTINQLAAALLKYPAGISCLVGSKNYLITEHTLVTFLASKEVK